MFRHRLFGIEFKPTNTMNEQTGTQAPAQAGIEDFNGIFQERLRGIVREGLLLMFEQEGFRRVRGHKELGVLAAALGRSGSVASSLRSSAAPPARPSAQEQFELTGEVMFSYQMSISQPTEILTI